MLVDVASGRVRSGCRRGRLSSGGRNPWRASSAGVAIEVTQRRLTLNLDQQTQALYGHAPRQIHLDRSAGADQPPSEASSFMKPESSSWARVSRGARRKPHFGELRRYLFECGVRLLLHEASEQHPMRLGPAVPAKRSRRHRACLARQDAPADRARHAHIKAGRCRTARRPRCNGSYHTLPQAGTGSLPGRGEVTNGSNRQGNRSKGLDVIERPSGVHPGPLARYLLRDR